MRYFWFLVVAALAACTENLQVNGPDCSQPDVGNGVDILGVRLGMDNATAIRILRCAGYAVEVKAGPIMDGNPANNVDYGVIAERDGDRLAVRFGGLSGSEKVVGMLRIIGPSKEGSELSVDEVRQSIFAKYGPLFEYKSLPDPSKGYFAPYSRGEYYRLSGDNQEIPVESEVSTCKSGVNFLNIESFIVGGANFRCGEFVFIQISPSNRNRALSDMLLVEVTNGVVEEPLRQERIRLIASNRARNLAREASDAKSRGTPDL
ncbi:MAG: hypothetical protein RLZZ245_3714 [Verrucomicrobiota bacterium]|jgi:hypothetical protein